MAENVQRVRRVAKVVASLATLWASGMAAMVWMGPRTHSGWETPLYTAVVTATPFLQIVLMGVGTVGERAHPRRAALFYSGAVLLLAPELVMMLTRDAGPL